MSVSTPPPPNPLANSYVEILTPKVLVLAGGAFGEWLGPEGEALLNGISALTDGIPQRSLTLLPSEHRKSAAQKTALTQPCWHPDYRLPAFRTVSNTFLVLLCHPVCGTALKQPEQTKTNTT